MAKPVSKAKWIAGSIAATTLLIGLLFAFRSLEQFLIQDPRFTLGEAGSETLEISGAAHIQARTIQAVFSDDYGRSVYLMPLTERRASLRKVDWVKDASVARFWPNRVVVGLTERKPVAFMNTADAKPPLIDEDGVILPPTRDHFALPVLVGVYTTSPEQQRRQGVRLMMRVMKDLGPAAGAVSRVDVTDPDNLKITEPFDGRSVTLLMGDRDFALRHRNFASYYAEIRKKLPNAITLDLRLEDRITVVQ